LIYVSINFKIYVLDISEVFTYGYEIGYTI